MRVLHAAPLGSIALNYGINLTQPKNSLFLPSTQQCLPMEEATVWVETGKKKKVEISAAELGKPEK